MAVDTLAWYGWSCWNGFQLLISCKHTQIPGQVISDALMYSSPLFSVKPPSADSEWEEWISKVTVLSSLFKFMYNKPVLDFAGTRIGVNLYYSDRDWSHQMRRLYTIVSLANRWKVKSWTWTMSATGAEYRLKSTVQERNPGVASSFSGCGLEVAPGMGTE